jgi:hypothetical protein
MDLGFTNSEWTEHLNQFYEKVIVVTK